MSTIHTTIVSQHILVEKNGHGEERFTPYCIMSNKLKYFVDFDGMNSFKIVNCPWKGFNSSMLSPAKAALKIAVDKYNEQLKHEFVETKIIDL